MDKVKEMLKKKLEERGYYDVEKTEKNQGSRPTYEEAKRAGDIRTLLNYKLGIYVAEDRQKELDSILDSLDIKAVTAELAEIGGKIEKESAEIEKQLERDKELCIIEYEQKLEAYYRRGGIRGGMKALLIQDDFDKALEVIEIKADKQRAEVKSLLYRKEILEKAKAKYMDDNAELIAELQKTKKIKEIQDSGLLGEID